MDIIDKLNLLSEYQSESDVLNMDKQAAIDSVLTPEIRAALADIEAEYAPKSALIADKITILEAEIIADTLTNGSTVKGTHYMAVYNKGRVSWDGKKLDGMMAIIPGLEAARKEGEPSVSIKSVK